MTQKNFSHDLNTFLPSPVRRIETILDETMYHVPVYDLNSVPQSHCARYVRYASKELFDRELPICCAWDLAKFYPRKTVGKWCKLHKTELVPGDILGVYYAESLYGKKERKYTHVSLYLGKRNEEHVFAEQFGIRTQVVTLSEMVDEELIPVEILRVSRS